MQGSPDPLPTAPPSLRTLAPLLMLGALAIGALLIANLVVRSRFTIHEVVVLLQTVQGHLWAMPAYLAIYIVATGLFAPAALFHVAAGVTWGFPLGATLNVLACNGGASLQFLLARKLGKRRVDAWVHQKHWDAVEQRLADGGFRAILAIRMLPLPTMAVNLGAGVSAIRYRDFALGTLLGTLPVTLIYTYFAAALAAGVSQVKRQVALEVLAAGALLLLFAFGPRLLTRLLRRVRKTGG